VLGSWTGTWVDKTRSLQGTVVLTVLSQGGQLTGRFHDASGAYIGGFITDANRVEMLLTYIIGKPANTGTGVLTIGQDGHLTGDITFTGTEGAQGKISFDLVK
jgi:hypothetical protein